MRTAVLGTGIMGAGMAGSLAREGHEVVVWNRTRARAERLAGERIAVAGSVAEAVDGADAVVTMLFDVDNVVAVAPELAEALGADAVWAQASTVGPAGIGRIADVAGVGDRLVDAPVLGTRKPAEDGALVVLASGPERSRSRLQPVFDAVGARTLAVGDELGRASALKLVANSWVALVNAGTAQALGLAEALGVEPTLFLDAIRGGGLDVPYAHLKGTAMLARSWEEPSFAVDGVVKDLGLMVDAAGDAGFPDDLLVALQGLYARSSEQGLGGADMAAVRAAFDG